MPTASIPVPTEPFLAGDFVVFPERNELRQLAENGGPPRAEAIRLTAKQMDVLVVLASKPGQPVGKNELFESVWPGVVVGEDNITSCIYELRKAFGAQHYIQTVRQRGYALNAPVVRPLPGWLIEELHKAINSSSGIVPAEIVSQLPPPPKPVFDRQGRRQLAFWLGIVILLVAIGFLWIDSQGNFTVGLSEFKNVSGEPQFDEKAHSLEKLFFAYFKDKKNPTFYRVRELNLFTSTSVRCEIDLAGKDRLKLSAYITDEPSPLVAEGPRDSAQGLAIQLFDKIRRVLDTRACHMESRVDPLKARHCFSAGSRQVKNRNYDDALELLEKAKKFHTELLSGDAPVEAAEGLLLTCDQLANIHDIQGERAAAKAEIEAALTLIADPTLRLGTASLGALRIRRRKAQIEEDVDTERKYLDELRNREHDDPDLRHSFGWFLHTHYRNCNKAELYLDEAIAGPDTDPSIRATYYSYKGDIQLDCGEPLEAIASYTEHVNLNPDEGDPYDMRADAYLMVGQYTQARQDLNTALRLNSDFSSATASKGDLERDLGNFADAEREYRAALAKSSSSPNRYRDVLIAFGRLDLLEGRYEAAKNRAMEAVKLDGGNRVQAYWLLGVASLHLDQPAETRAALSVIEDHFAKTPSRYLREYLWHLRAQVALEENRGDRAVADLKQAIEDHPTDRIFFMAALGEAYQRLGRSKEALAAYQQLLQINPRHPRTLCAAAELAERLSSREEAAAFYARALDILGQQTDDPFCQPCLDRGRALAQRPSGGSR